MRPSESGKITLKAILALAFIAAVIFACFKTIPFMSTTTNFKITSRIKTPFWVTQHATADAVRKNILAKAEDLGLPIVDDNVTVEGYFRSKVSGQNRLRPPVDLKVYTLQLHFTPSSENRAI